MWVFQDGPVISWTRCKAQTTKQEILSSGSMEVSGRSLDGTCSTTAPERSSIRKETCRLPCSPESVSSQPSTWPSTSLTLSCSMSKPSSRRMLSLRYHSSRPSKFNSPLSTHFQIFSRETLGDFANVIPFLIGILLIGSLNSNLFSGSRYMYAAARQGHLPACFSCVNERTDSPRVAVLAQVFPLLRINVTTHSRVFSLCSFRTLETSTHSSPT